MFSEFVALAHRVGNWIFVSQMPQIHRRRRSSNWSNLSEQLEFRTLLSAAAIAPAPTTTVAQPPTVSGVGGTLTYAPGSTQLLFATNIVLSDSHSSNLTGATVSFANWQSDDRVEFYDPSPLTWTFTKNLTTHTAQLTISGSASVAAYQQELRTLGFFSVSSNPPSVTRVANIQVTDGTASSNVASESIRIGQAPVVSGLCATSTWVIGGNPVSLDSLLTVTDAQSSTLHSATVTFTNWQTGDRLTWSSNSAIQASFTTNLTNHTATLTLSGTASLAAYQTQLRSLQFSNTTINPATTPRVMTIQVADSIATSNPVFETIDIAAAPVLSGFGGTATYQPGGSPVNFASGIKISDTGGTTLNGATISFTNWQSGDRVEFSGDYGLAYTFTENLTTHTAVLQLSGQASLAVYQSELRSLGFFSVSSTPSTTPRQVTIQVNNGAVSNSVTEKIDVS